MASSRRTCLRFSSSTRQSVDEVRGSSRSSCSVVSSFAIGSRIARKRSIIVSTIKCASSIGEPGGLTRSEEHTSELQSLMRISYAVFCLKKKKTQHEHKKQKIKGHHKKKYKHKKKQQA